MSTSNKHLAFKEASVFLVMAAVFTWMSWLLVPWLSPLGAILFIYILYFFRDPNRTVPNDPRAIVSAADGKVIVIDEVECAPLTGKRMKRIAVFLSVFNVHVNRAPFAGKVVKTDYYEGLFLDARKSDIDLKNEHLNWLIETPQGPIVVQQIAGLIARRIVAWKKEGDAVEKGERFGMIRFGSRTDVYLPLDCEINVRIDQIVQGASTVIAKMPNV